MFSLRQVFSNVLAGSRISGETFVRLLSENEFRRVISRERERASRNQHMVSLVLFVTAASAAGTADFESLIGAISNRKRKVDEIGWYDKCHLGLVLPYTSQVGALSLIQSIYQTIGSRYRRPVSDIYTYPSDRQKIQW